MEALGLGYSRECVEQRCLEVVLDTNFIILLSKYPHLIDELNEVIPFKSVCVLLTVVLEELEAVSKTLSEVRKRMLGKILGVLRGRCVVVDAGGSGIVDEAIIDYARKHQAVVATNDRELRRRLREMGIPNVFFREESRRLEYEGFIS
jgi:rRNA-processing protein FCF1